MFASGLSMRAAYTRNLPNRLDDAAGSEGGVNRVLSLICRIVQATEAALMHSPGVTNRILKLPPIFAPKSLVTICWLVLSGCLDAQNTNTPVPGAQTNG